MNQPGRNFETSIASTLALHLSADMLLLCMSRIAELHIERPRNRTRETPPDDSSRVACKDPRALAKSTCPVAIYVALRVISVCN